MIHRTSRWGVTMLLASAVTSCSFHSSDSSASSQPTTSATSVELAAVQANSGEAVSNDLEPAGIAAVSASCGIQEPAFCETFDAPNGNGGKTGDLDPVLWGVSRVGDINPSSILNQVSYTSMSGCGSDDFLAAPHDVRICNGQMFETVNDGGGVSSLHTYPKQPFNFADRTGEVTFDVSADSGGTHAAWPEFFITDKPVPGMRGMISGVVPPMAHNSIGFSLAACLNGDPEKTGVNALFMSKEGVYSQPALEQLGCIAKGSPEAMNHIVVRISVDQIEVLGTDPGAAELVPLASADNLALTFSQGLVWLNDVHYNARKAIEPCACGTQWNHTFAWDNLGFDGPKTYRDLGFDVPDAAVSGEQSGAGDETVALGHLVGDRDPLALMVTGVNWVQQPTAAQVVFNTYSFEDITPEVRVNGGDWHDPADRPTDNIGYSWRTLSIPIPIEDVVDGTNTIEFRSTNWSTTVANVSVILVAGAPVP